MGWLTSALVALLLVSALALALPTLFGPAVAGIAPLLIVLALIGLGAMWWRHSRHRVDPGVAESPRGADEEREDITGDERVQT